MSVKKLPVVDMTKVNSKKFGTLITSQGVKPAYKGNDFSFIKNIVVNRFKGDVSFSIVDVTKGANNITPVLEHHRQTKEVLIPTQSDIVLILALGNSKMPDLKTAKALRLKQGDAFMIDEQVWHYAPLTSKDSSKVFVVFTSTTPDKDMYAVTLCDAFGMKLGI